MPTVKSSIATKRVPRWLLGGVILLLHSICVSVPMSEDALCSDCHVQQVTDWKKSHHFNAMALANPNSVLGNFNNQTIGYQNDQARFYKKGDDLYIEMANLAGVQESYRVTYSFGYQPLQQYMFDAGLGKQQFFPFAWDSRAETEGGQRWFVLYPDQQPHDEFHWSQMGQNWNQMCADCHSTNFKKNYDPVNRRYSSSFDAINVSCSACHGKPDQHLAWAKGDTKIVNKGYKHYIGAKTPLFRQSDQGLMESIAKIKPSEQVQVCASCHSRRSQLSDRTEPKNYFEHYQPALITPELYHVDGQILDEDYVFGSFLQSKMYQAGVTCSNCHNPHSGELKFTKNKTCTQCHTTSTYDTSKHHGHVTDNAGSFCVDCHMPTTRYMQVDLRRDHSFQIPRPDLSLRTGAPNACTGCHSDRSSEWASEAIKVWSSDQSKMGQEHFSQAFYNADIQAFDAAAQLYQVAQDASAPDIIRASAISRMTGTPGDDAINAINTAVLNVDPLKRQAAITAANSYPVAARWGMLNRLLDDQHAPIRTEAARSLAGMLKSQEQTLSHTDEKRLKAALDEYRAAQQYQADRGFSHANLGNLALGFGLIKKAENHFRDAISVEPIFMPAYVNLADIYRVRGDEPEVQRILKQALAINPTARAVHYSLAMSLIRENKKPQALASLRQATNLDSATSEENPDYLYAYALLLIDQGMQEKAEHSLLRLYQLTPNNPSISYTLAQFYAEQSRYQEALYYARKLKQLMPGSHQADELVKKMAQMVSN